MSTTRAFAVGSTVLLMAVFGSSCLKHVPDSGGAPVRIYVAKKVRTMDAERPLAEAVAVQGSRIVAVGTRAEVTKAHRDAEVVELGNATIVPGLIDAHGHLLALGQWLSTVNLANARSSAELVERMKKAPPSSYQGEWLMGRGWNQNEWAEEGKQFPTREGLDEAFPTTPVRLTRIDGHAAWVNAEALKRAGITRDTKDPEGGKILRDEKGEPTGVLIDNAMDLLKHAIPEPTDVDRERWLTNALERCAEVGLTSVHDAGMDLRTFTLLQHLDMAGTLPIRVYAMANGQDEAQVYLDRGPFAGRMLVMKSVKFYADGALGSRGAALHEPYSDDHHSHGLLLISPEELERRVKEFTARGFQSNVHAIGDRANTIVLDVFERLSAEDRERFRPRVEHSQIIREQDLPRFAKLKVAASIQPTHATSDLPWAKERLGEDRLKGAYAWRALKDAGANVVLGSDFPIEDPNPLEGIYAARTRQTKDGKPDDGWSPEQRLSGEEALEGFTKTNAWAEFAEERRGQLKPGMDADFTVLEIDPVEAPPQELLGKKVLRTIVAGREVYAR